MCTALVVGNMIGAGVFLLPATLGAFGGISIVGWVFTSAGAVLLALVFSSLARSNPRAGGPYAYTRDAFGDLPGFLVAWGYWISAWAGNAAIAVAFVGYLGFFIPVVSATPAMGAATALAVIWALTWVNTRGIVLVGGVQLVTTVLKLLPLLVIGTIGLLQIDPGHYQPMNLSGQSHFGAISAVAAVTLWAFLGLESATIPAADVHDPRRTIPLATIMGTVLAALVYILSTAAVIGVVPPEALVSSTAPFADAARSMWGEMPAQLVAAGAAISCLGALNGWILVQGQIPLAAARDGLFPRSFARVSPTGTPVFGLTVSSALISLLLFANFTRGLVSLFTFVILLATVTTLVPYVFCSLAPFLTRDAEGRGPGRTIRVIAGLAFLYSLWAVGGSGHEAVYWGFLLLLSGVPVYVLSKRYSATND
jgi:APA family basic amino acid/polyamine antiporter